MKNNKLKKEIKNNIKLLDKLVNEDPTLEFNDFVIDKYNTYRNILEADTLIVSAFPGCGKTYFYNQMKDSGLNVIDSDSSTFDKADFPDNYIEHIENNIGKQDIILVSSHKEVRDAMNEVGIEFVLAFPHINLKTQYIERYKERGSNEAFIKLIDDNWFEWISPLTQQKGAFPYALESNEYLSNILDEYEETKTNV